MNLQYKVVKKNGKPQVEVRWSRRTANVLLVVGLDGYTHRYYGPGKQWGANTEGKNVHLSMNGPLMLSFSEWGEFMNELGQAVNEAKRRLKDLT